MKRFILVLITVSLAFVGCNSEGDGEGNLSDTSASNPQAQRIKELETQAVEQDSAISAFLQSFNEIQANLDSIKQKENLVSSAASSGDVKNKQDQIVNDIQSIYDLMNKNKEKIAVMANRLKKANVRITEFEKTIEMLNQQIAQRDGEIANLRDELERMNLELINLTLNYQEQEDVSNQKTAKLNTAYYAFGTSKELIKQGVISKEGGLLGIGKTKQLTQNFNKGYFTRIDITKTVSIELAAKKAKILTNHPIASYKLEGGKDRVDRITINDAEEFWSASKYLVIVTE